MNELDYGTLLCWANNSVGLQQYPCVFQIVAAGKPDPPHNCRVFDVTTNSLQVNCLAGDDGGLMQEFVLQVYQIGATSPVVEKSRHSPSFSVANLRPATDYKIVIAAINEKGASRITELKAYTVKLPEIQEETSAEPTRDRDRGSKLPLGVIIGTAVTATPIVIVIIVVAWIKLCRGHGNAGNNRSDHNSHSIEVDETHPSARSGCVVTTTSSSIEALSENNSEKEDRNPDVISHTKALQHLPPASWPTECQDIGDIATISKSTYLLSKSCSDYPSKIGTDSNASKVVGMNYCQIGCPETNDVQTQLPKTTASISHVPYYVSAAAQQRDDAENLVVTNPRPFLEHGYRGAEQQDSHVAVVTRVNPISLWNISEGNRSANHPLAPKAGGSHPSGSDKCSVNKKTTFSSSEQLHSGTIAGKYNVLRDSIDDLSLPRKLTVETATQKTPRTGSLKRKTILIQSGIPTSLEGGSFQHHLYDMAHAPYQCHSRSSSGSLKRNFDRKIPNESLDIFDRSLMGSTGTLLDYKRESVV